MIKSYSDYEAWKLDKSFISTYNKIKDRTVIDLHRCFSLWSLVKESNKLKKGEVIEIGSFDGGSGVLIAKRVESLNSKLKVYLCDTFEGVVKVGKNDPVITNGKFKCRNENQFREFVKTHVDNVTILKGIFPEESASSLVKTKFRFCHIDVDIYQSAKDVFNFIWPRMVKGGIVVFDDYGFLKASGVRTFVDEISDCKDRIVIINLNGQAILIKV